MGGCRTGLPACRGRGGFTGRSRAGFPENSVDARDDKALSHQKKVIFFSTNRSVGKENFRV
jgi:hypothetical protein